MTTFDNLRADSLVAIVGAGPAGLTLARLLQGEGFAVRVFERDASATARPQGGSLDLRPSLGQKAIRAAGLWDVFAAQSRDDAKAFRLLDPRGEPIPGDGEETHEDAGPEIDRGTLRRLLLDAVEPGTVAWGHAVAEVRAEADGRWRLEFEGREPVVADLVVGADGVGSKVRASLTPVRPTYVGHAMLAATIRPDLWRGTPVSDFVGEGSVMIADGSRTIFVQRCADDLILLYFSMKVAEDWPATEGFALDDTDAVLGAIRAAYAGWSPDLLAMLTQVAAPFQRWPLSVLPPDHRWAGQRGLTILGDAAHAMPPFTGKGVNLAMLDALELAQALTADPRQDVTRAVAGFEAAMQARTLRETGACLEVGRSFYGIMLDFEGRAAA